MNLETHEKLLVEAAESLKKLGQHNNNFLLILVGIFLNITFFIVGGINTFILTIIMMFLISLLIAGEMNFKMTDKKLKKILTQLNSEEK